jgi:hypothetical protein
MVTSLIRPSFKQGFAKGSLSKRPNLWKGLVGCWEPSLGCIGIETFRDVSGRGNHGIFASTSIDDWVIGANPKNPGYALNFDGSNYVDVSIINNDINTVTGTLAIWVKLYPADSNKAFFDIRVNSNSHQLGISWINADNEIRYLYYEGSVTEVRSNKLTEGGDWGLLVQTWDTNTNEFKAYFNGAQEGATQTIPTTISGSIDNSYIGYNGFVDDRFNGLNGGTRLYNRVLSLLEIRDMYQYPNVMFQFRDRRIGRVAEVVGNPWYYYANQRGVMNVY